MLAADRAQFLIWTLIGVGGFIFLLLRQLPETIVQLPEVNSDLLSAMGVSAVVYVLGKSVRLPGPVISTVTVTAGVTSFDLKIDGVNLHQDATISVDGQAVEVTRVASAAPAAPNPVSPNLLPQLTVKLAATGPWTSGDHLLRVTNLDGQFAEVWFAANLPKLTATAAPSVVASAQAVDLTLAGTDLRPGSTAEWLAPAAAEPVPVDQVAVTPPASVTVTFKPGTVKGVGTLSLISPHGMRTSQQIEVK